MGFKRGLRRAKVAGESYGDSSTEVVSELFLGFSFLPMCSNCSSL